MTTTSADLGFPTLVDNVKRTDPNGAIAQIVESLSKMSPLLADAVFQEGNLPTGHRFTSRTALPSVGWRRFNEGTSPSKSITDQVDESCGMLSGYSIVDVDLANLNGNAAAFRASEDQGFLQALKIEAEKSFFYASTKTTPEKIMGLSPRLDSTTGPWGKQIVAANSSASGNDQSSIWLVGWGPQTVFGVYPKGMVGGLQSEDLGKQVIDPAGDGKKMTAWVTEWKWKLGLCVKDARYLVRVCNIDESAFSASDEKILDAIITAYHKTYDPDGAKFVWYMNRTVATFLHKESKAAGKYQIQFQEPTGGRPPMTMMGYPVRITDALTKTEAAVS
jgi:hypothetical protein